MMSDRLNGMVWNNVGDYENALRFAGLNMARAEHRFICNHCGTVHARWAGRCDGCGEWNALAEDKTPKTALKGLKAGAGRTIELVGLDSAKAVPDRLPTGIDELERVLGGGLVKGSAILIGSYSNSTAPRPC